MERLQALGLDFVGQGAEFGLVGAGFGFEGADLVGLELGLGF